MLIRPPDDRRGDGACFVLGGAEVAEAAVEAAGLTVWLVNARDVKQVTGRPKTDKLDVVWLAKLNERGHAATELRATS